MFEKFRKSRKMLMQKIARQQKKVQEDMREDECKKMKENPE